MIEKRRALPYHKTPTTDDAWDGPENEARLKIKDEDAYREAYAWVDPQGDAETKGAYKFIHHEVDADGKVGAANTRACSAGIAVLNGGRGGANIPDDDRHGVYAHLCAHLKDAGKNCPELNGANGRRAAFERMTDGQIERRTIVTELRASEGDGARYITGHGAVFDQEAEIWDGIFEVVRPGAFSDTINKQDVRALFNHNPDYVLGRNKAGTLQLSEDETGLAYRILLNPDVSYARDLYASLQRGDITQSSYAFVPTSEKWTQRDDGSELRELLSVELHDVSPVTYPAFVGADSQARGLRRPAFDLGQRPRPEGANEDRAGALRLRRARLALRARIYGRRG